MQEPHASAAPRRRSVALVCSLLLGLFYLNGWFSFHAKSATADEALHSVGGYFHVFQHDYRINAEDPPLWNYWAMLPHHAGELQPDEDVELYEAVIRDMLYQFATASRLLFEVVPNDGAAFINSSRAVMLILGVILGAMIATWSYTLAGATAALVACTLYCFDPNFLAHAPLVKNDVALTLLMFSASWAAWSVGRRARWWNILGLALACAAAVSTKFSGLLLLPIAALILIVRSILPADWVVLGRVLRSRARRLSATLAIGVVIAVVSYTTIWASYGFRYDPTPTPGVSLNTPLEVKLLKRTELSLSRGWRNPTTQQIDDAPLTLMPQFVLWCEKHRALPQAWLFGFLYTYRSTLVRDSFLMGQYGNTGWWYYFPMAMLFKTPVATLLAMGAALGVCVWCWCRRRAASALEPWSFLCLTIPLGIYGASALTSNLNLGLRHVLPIYPFVYLLVAVVAATVHRNRPRSFKWMAGVLGIGLAVESVAAFPHYLSFFNTPSRPFRLNLLSDSNLDWGQDLTYVAEWQQKNPGVPLYLGYFGCVDPPFYGIRYQHIPGGFSLEQRQIWPPTEPGVVVLSATLLQGVNCSPSVRELYEPFRRRRPDAILGDTMYLYRWPLK